MEYPLKGAISMELLQLTYFCDAAVTQNFSQTAKRFSVPASNISQSIKRLEEELGTSLFSRTANRVTLNSRGEAFYREVNSALLLLQHAKNAAQGAAEEGVLRLGVRISRRVVMQAVSAFQSRFPNINIVAEHGDHTQSNDFDLIISDGTFSHPEFVKGKSFRERIMLAAKRGTLPGNGILGCADIMDRPFITMRANYSMYNLTQEICRDMGFEPRIALQGEDPEYIRQCVNLGLGVAFVPTLSWHGQLSEDVELRAVGDYGRDICVYRRKNAYAPEYVEAFYRMLVTAFEQEAAQI